MAPPRGLCYLLENSKSAVTVIQHDSDQLGPPKNPRSFALDPAGSQQPAWTEENVEIACAAGGYARKT
eukprot:1146929-Pelagomonas_calceolata.AAC.2